MQIKIWSNEPRLSVCVLVTLQPRPKVLSFHLEISRWKTRQIFILNAIGVTLPSLKLIWGNSLLFFRFAFRHRNKHNICLKWVEIDRRRKFSEHLNSTIWTINFRELKASCLKLKVNICFEPQIGWCGKFCLLLFRFLWWESNIWSVTGWGENKY